MHVLFRYELKFLSQIEKSEISFHVKLATEGAANLRRRVVPLAIVLASSSLSVKEATQLLVERPIVSNCILAIQGNK